MKGNIPLGCGRCLPCRVKVRDIWANRLMLEKSLHGESCFLTLTYEDSELNCTYDWYGDKPMEASLVHRDLTLFLKKLRKHQAKVGRKIRYFAVGEYGEKLRPHYHLAVFGLSSCCFGKTSYTRSGRNARCCRPCRDVESLWSYGRVELNELNEKTCKYVGKYIVKRLIKEEDSKWTKKVLKSRIPEFRRMSLNPGIGKVAIKRLFSSMVDVLPQGKNILAKFIPVPVVLRRNGRTFPLGRYLREIWRECATGNRKAPLSEVLEYSKKMSEMLGVVKEKFFRKGVPLGVLGKRELVLLKYRSKRESLIKRIKIFDKGDKI